ncbi:MAG: restriction endonuclease subunit S [Cycloclasticus sp.]|nr:restriction endonuclease subunit S [Cycloclasticus sp.]
MTSLQTVKFGDICREVKLTTKDPIADGYERYIGLEHLDSGSLKIKRWGMIAEDSPSFTRVFRKGNILFGKRRPYLKKAAIAEFDGICSGDIIVMEPNKDIEELFPFIVQSSDFWNWAIQTSSGSLSPRTKFKSLAEFNLGLPDREGCNALLKGVKISNKVVNGTDVIIDAHNQVLKSKYIEFFKNKFGISDSSTYPTKIYSSKNIKIKFLKDLLVIKPQNGQFVKKGNTGEIKCLFLNVVDGYVNPYTRRDNREFITCTKSEYDKYSLNTGDILFNRSSLVKSGIGWPYLVLENKERSTFDCHLIRVNLDIQQVLPEYLYIYSLSPWARKYFLCVGQTTTMTTISQSEIENFPIPVPTIEKQKEVIEIFSKLYALDGYLHSHIDKISNLSTEYISNNLRVV